MSLTWPNHVLHRTSRRSGKDTRTRCIGSIYSLLNEKDWSSIKQDVMQSSFTIHSQLIVSRKLLWWNLEKSYTRKYMRHIDLLQRFLLKIIGWKNWIQKLLEAAETPNESNPKPNYQERWEPWVNNSSPEKDVLFGREGWSRRYQTLNKNGETRGWTTVHPKKMSCLVAKVPNTQQERWHPWVDKSPPRWRKSTLISEYQDCHTQL